MAERPKDPIHPGPPSGGPGEYMGVGLQFAASIALFLFGGRWLDGRLGTTPWLMVAGVLVGGAAGFYSIYSKLMRDQRARDEEKRRDREGR